MNPPKLALVAPLNHNNPEKSWSYPSTAPLHPVFSYRTSGFQGGDHSWLEIKIENNQAQMKPRKVSVCFWGDIELRAVVKGLEDLVQCLRFELPIDRDGHHA